MLKRISGLKATTSDVRAYLNEAGNDYDVEGIMRFLGSVSNAADKPNALPDYVASSAYTDGLAFLQDQLREIPWEQGKDKKYARQGGSFSQTTFNQSYMTYYDIPEITGNADMLVSAADYLSQHIERPDSYILDNAVEHFHTYKGKHRSIGGATLMSDRRPMIVRRKAICHARTAPYTADPQIKGMRLKYTKWRDIFMDSFTNQYRATRVLYNLFAQIKKFACDTEEDVQQHLSDIGTVESGIELDMTAMDKSVTYPLVELIRPLMQIAFHLSGRELEQVYWFLESYMRAPLIVPNKVLFGEHALFSGLYITHDMENILSFLMAYTKVNEWITSRNPKARYGKDWTLLISGDDVTVCFRSSYPRKSLQQLASEYSAFVAQFGFEANIDKQRIFTRADGYFAFCKKNFPLPMRKNSQKQYVHYSSAFLAYNNICNPERFHSVASDGIGAIKLMLCQISDAVAGSPAYGAYMQTIVKYVDPQVLAYEPTVDDIAAYAQRDVSWEDVMWAATYDYTASPTRKWLSKVKNNLMSHEKWLRAQKLWKPLPDYGDYLHNWTI